MKVFSIISTSDGECNEDAGFSEALRIVVRQVPTLHTIVCNGNNALNHNVINHNRKGQNRVHIKPTRDCIQHEFGCDLY